MVWHALLQPTNAMLLALLPTTVDRIVVWGAFAALICLIAWREYTLPDIASPSQAVDARAGSLGILQREAEAPLPGVPLPEATLEGKVTPAV